MGHSHARIIVNLDDDNSRHTPFSSQTDLLVLLVAFLGQSHTTHTYKHVGRVAGA